MIRLGKPYIENNRLYVKIDDNGSEKLLWYQVEEKYTKYLCTERLDGVVITILLYAMQTGQDIYCEEKISEKLYYQIVNFLIPTLSKHIKEYKKINIITKLDSKQIQSENAVGTGISCGVDSFYTIFSNINKDTKNFNVTHLTCFNVGGNGSYGGEKARKLFKERIENSRKFAKESGFQFVMVDSNISEIIQMLNIETHSFRQMAVPLLLQKLFSKYYYSSGYDFNSFEINKSDTAYFDLLNVHCFSNENLDFYSTGGELTRIEKIEFISKFEETHKYLNVCTQEGKNCSKCEKCNRTMLGLYSIGKLEKYKEVFDIDYFYKKLNWNLADIFKYKERDCYKEVYVNMKANNKKIPIISYILGILKRLKRKIKNEG